MYLFFDTETTGKADFKKPATDPCQPRLVQLGAILYTPNAKQIAEINCLIYPEGFTIPEAASKIHGTTTEMALQDGILLYQALALFSQFACLSSTTTIVAHNIDYDKLIMAREGAPLNKPLFCTMKALTPICKIPGPFGNKWPTLQEAHTFCFKEPFVGAHDALADVKACASIFFWMKEKGLAV